MKILTLLLLSVLVFSCSEPVTTTLDPVTPELDCDALLANLKNFNDLQVKKEINELCSQFPNQMPDTNDMVGHRENMNQVMELLNECEGVDASLLCYACLKTKPLQSEVHFIIDDGDVVLKRKLWIYAPVGEEMYVAKVD